MTTIYSAYDKIADVMATLDAAQLASLRASGEMQQRYLDLVEASKEGILDKRQKDELDHFIVLERLIRLAKLRAEKVTRS